MGFMPREFMWPEGPQTTNEWIVYGVLALLLGIILWRLVRYP
jgi:hypothetical protein